MPSRHKQLADDSEDYSKDFDRDSDSDGESTGACCRRRWPLLIAGLAVVGACAAALEVRRPSAAATGGVANAWRTCGGEGRPGGPEPDLHLHFLFMAGQGLPHLDIWRRFFEDAPRGSFHVWVHCQSAEVCRAAFDAQGLADFAVVPKVYNAWCDDLLSPMVQLLTYAMNATGDLPAKFIFSSETNLPVKPFRVIREELAKHPGASDFCVFPVDHYWLPARNKTIYMVKASQWSVLSLQDAQVLLDRLPEPSPDKAMDFPVIGNVSFAEFPPCLCPDELFVFGNIFGLFDATAGANFFPGVGELAIDPGWLAERGCCRTWLMFGAGQITASVLEGEKKVSQMGMLLTDMEMDNASVLSAPSTHGVEAIYVMHVLGPVALRALRSSSFLFARKFDAAATFPGFAEVMFAD